MRKKIEAEWREERQRWEEREEEEKKGMHSALRERVKRAEAEVESHLERLAESKRNTVKLQERIQVRAFSLVPACIIQRWEGKLKCCSFLSLMRPANSVDGKEGTEVEAELGGGG